MSPHVIDEVLLSTDDEVQAEIDGPSKNPPGPSKQVVGQSKGHLVDDDDSAESADEDPAVNQLAKASQDLSYILNPDSMWQFDDLKF